MWMLKLFRRPSVMEIAAQDYINAQHNLLEAHKELEWATARIAAYEARIERLKKLVIESANES